VYEKSALTFYIPPEKQVQEEQNFEVRDELGTR